VEVPFKKNLTRRKCARKSQGWCGSPRYL